MHQHNLITSAEQNIACSS